MELGQVIKELRKRHGWSQWGLATILGAGWHQATIANLEAGKTRSPRAETLGPLAAAFGLTIDQLLALRDAATPEDLETRIGALVPLPAPELPANVPAAWARQLERYGRYLSARQRQNLLNMVRALAEEAAERDHQPEIGDDPK